MKNILGLDLGSNSIGWALLTEENNNINGITDCGVRIFQKSVEEKVPTPKNQKRRDMRLGRRVLQRRARRKQVMINYLISLNLLPKTLKERFNTEKQLNELGNPYELRAKGLDEQLTPHEFGRVLLHFVARRGFLSSKKQLAGDLIDDPDTQEYLAEIDNKKNTDKEENKFKEDIAEVYKAITDNQYRTLGEYLYKFRQNQVKRNRSHDGGHLRTDRAMYEDELAKIWKQQKSFFNHLPPEFMAKKDGVKKIIFYQRPLKLKKDRIGKCTLEPNNYRASMARLEVQQFRYLQDINNIKYFEPQVNQYLPLGDTQRQELVSYFEKNHTINKTELKKMLGLAKNNVLDVESKNLKGNTTAYAIIKILGDIWHNYTEQQQKSLVEDLLSLQKKSALKKRLINHWRFEVQTAIKLCLLELEPEYSNLSLKAINKILPYLKQGLIYSKKDKITGELGALQSAGYEDERKEIEKLDKLPAPPETSNPIVNKGLHELKRVINAIIKEHGKPDVIRIEMARDLEMNTMRYKDNEKMQITNKEANEEAEAEYLKYHSTHSYTTKEQKLRYRLWKEQNCLCAYSGNPIGIQELWADAVEIDHIVPKSLCLDDSYVNKVVCKTSENRYKGQKTPIEAWGNDEEKWHQITQRIEGFYPDRQWKKYRKSKTHPKKKQFLMRQADIDNKYGMSASQLNDTRYISKLAQDYLGQLDCVISTTKGAIVAEVRHLWYFNNLIGETDKKERIDHRHHTIDATVIACMDIGFHTRMTKAIKDKEEGRERKIKIYPPYINFKDELDSKLKSIIVSHNVQRKLSGALHEETGAGYLALKDKKTNKIIKQGLVYRKTLNADFSIKNTNSIVDEGVRNVVLEHISNYNNVKEAFTTNELPKIGKNTIKRVRVWQSSTTLEKLNKTKLALKDKQNNIFKWMAYGNNHHVEIIQHKETKDIKGFFITMMEAHNRAKGIGKLKQAIINQNHGDDYQFLYALHINDLVSIENEQGKSIFYRVQKLDSGSNRFIIRLHTASTLKNKNEEIYVTINKEGFNKHKLQVHKANAIGKLLDD